MTQHTLTGIPDVLIVGGGIVGLAVALELERAGVDVDVLEAEHVGAGASAAAAGLLAPVSESGAEPDSLDSVFQSAHALWPAWSSELVDDPSEDLAYDDTPSLVPVLDDDSRDAETLEAMARSAERLGLRHEIVTGETLRSQFDQLSPHVTRALVLPDEHRVDPSRVLDALVHRLTRSGVVIHRNRPVEEVRLDRTDGVVVAGPGWRCSAPRVVVTAGAWTAKIEGLGTVPVRPVRGQMIAYGGQGGFVAGAVRSRGRYAFSRGDDLLVGATEEDAGFDVATTEAARLELAQFAGSIFPGLRWKRVSRQWAGLRPASADGRPLIGPLEGERIVLATGHHRNGILLAPWTGQQIARMIVGKTSDVPDELEASRFASPS